MNIINSTPREDGYRMPGEFERHKGCLMIWPYRPGSWIYEAKKAQKVFSKIATMINETEQVYMLVPKHQLDNARIELKNAKMELENEKLESKNSQVMTNKNRDTDIIIIEMESDDAWARDVGPTFVRNDKEQVRGINWSFNAWGGEYDGLYASWDKDDKIAKSFLEYMGDDCYDAAPFVLEGGSIHADGEGTLVVTQSCLLSKGRNPLLTKEQIEQKLKQYCNVEKIIWLPRGIYNDETNEHVDNVFAFTAPGQAVLAWTDDENDPQYALSKSCLDVLERESDAKGRRILVRKLYIPSKPVCITKEELEGYVFETGEDERQIGERLAASYVNFYIANDAIIVPQFDDVNDEAAIKVLKEAFKDRTIKPVYARDIIVGGGNIHCITQQVL